jgi:hypothetical protein
MVLRHTQTYGIQDTEKYSIFPQFVWLL